jgi:hypothetical protein
MFAPLFVADVDSHISYVGADDALLKLFVVVVIRRALRANGRPRWSGYEGVAHLNMTKPRQSCQQRGKSYLRFERGQVHTEPGRASPTANLLRQRLRCPC